MFFRAFSVALAVVVAVAGSAFAANSIRDETFTDAKRSRDVPVRIYAPQPLEGTHPIVLVSHGLGGSRENMPYLGRALADAGYVAVHMQHIGTDQSVWEGKKGLEAMRALRNATKDPAAIRARFEDVPFVIDELARRNTGTDALAGHLDLAHIGMAGHSFGAVSTMVAAGQGMGPQAMTLYKEPRIKAGFPMSPNTPEAAKDLDKAYSGVDIALFHATGTKDDMPSFLQRNFNPAQRTVPYQKIKAPNQYLLVLDGAVHADFSGQTREKGEQRQENETRYTDAVKHGAVLFFDAYLRDAAAAKNELRSDYASTLEPGDRFEWK